MRDASKYFDVIVVGGGAAGMMAALSARRHHPALAVAILEKSATLGRKLLVSGAGRCNLTNLQLREKPERFYLGTGQELARPVFKQFGFPEIVEFFSELGVRLSPEKKGEGNKMFPVTQQAKTVLTALETELRSEGVRIITDAEIIALKKNLKTDQFILRTKDGGEFTCQKVILTTGGRTYPALGSDGLGYDLARALGHSLVAPIVSAVPLEAKNPLSQVLQGVKMELGVRLQTGKKVLGDLVGDVIFTKYGLSGSAILELSRAASIELNRDKGSALTVLLNFFPGETLTETHQWFDKIFKFRPNKKLVEILRGSLPYNLPNTLLAQLQIALDKKVGQLTKPEIDSLLKNLTAYEVRVTATRGWNEAEFTAGGILASEINNALESKKVPGLYLAGEVIDIDGAIGGFNLSWAWSSGFVAGQLQ